MPQLARLQPRRLRVLLNRLAWIASFSQGFGSFFRLHHFALCLWYCEIVFYLVLLEVLFQFCRGIFSIATRQCLQSATCGIFYHCLPLLKLGEHFIFMIYIQTYGLLSSIKVRKYSASPRDLTLSFPQTLLLQWYAASFTMMGWKWESVTFAFNTRLTELRHGQTL